ncbi:MAG: hypothetical protein EOO38_00090 [Cytophagaceae bacterium]|nr:MAG: hypothetical protein EOO38_00090 [Cytophagaceae bacterium]
MTDSIPFDASATPLQSETLSLDQVIELGCQAALMECRVAMPCQVTALNADGSVNVAPGFKTRFLGQAEANMPELIHVPVGHIQGSDFRVQFPVAVGDTGYCLTMDRRIDAWLAYDGSPQSPGDSRTHHLSDAIFLPMLTPEAQRKQDAGTDMVLENGALTLRLKKNGHLQVSNSQKELVSVIDALLQANIALIDQVKLLQVLTAMGPAPVIASTITALNQVQAQFQSIKQDADTFLGS